MPPARALRQNRHRHHRFGAARGFTLVEILVVVVIISLLAMVAIPGVKIVQRRAKSSAIVNDFRVFATAFETYAHEKGTFPAEAAVGGIPAGMETYLKSDAWQRVTPMGGHYNWEKDQLHGGPVKAAIAITGTADAPLPYDVNQLLDIDKAIDDGNPLTGNFRLGVEMCPLFIIER